MTPEEEKRIASEMYRRKASKLVDRLFTAQASLALGTQYLYRVDIETTEGGKERRSKPKLITDPTEIEDYLHRRYDERHTEYYFIATEKPDIKAIDSILDRALGRARPEAEAQTPQDDLGVIAYPIIDAPAQHIESLPPAGGSTAQALEAEAVEALGGEGVL